jgi:hypothetical protein
MLAKLATGAINEIFVVEALNTSNVCPEIALNVGMFVSYTTIVSPFTIVVLPLTVRLTTPLVTVPVVDTNTCGWVKAPPGTSVKSAFSTASVTPKVSVWEVVKV